MIFFLDVLYKLTIENQEALTEIGNGHDVESTSANSYNDG
jgi:hypothetical protein